MLSLFIMLATIGFGLSLYAYLLEKKIELQPDYKPRCDISDDISCTKPIKSKYTNLFFLPNSVIGMLFYLAIGLFALLNMPKLIFAFAIGGFIGTLFFAYVLYFKIKTLCLICTSLYIINIIILFLAVQLYYL